MQKTVLLLAVFLAAAGIVQAADEEITITTYYPSPQGSYNDLDVHRKLRQRGDIDGDGKLSTSDAFNILRLSGAGPLNPVKDMFGDDIPDWVGDMDGDGKTCSKDYLILVNKLKYNAVDRPYNMETFFNPDPNTNSGAALIVTDGNVGIGTTGPGAKLDIQQTFAVDKDILRIGHNTSGYFSFARNPTTGTLSLQGSQVNYSNIVLAPTSGNVGIGVTGPDNRLHVMVSDALTPAPYSQTVLKLEHAEGAYLTLAGPESSNNGILWQSPSAYYQGRIYFHTGTGKMSFSTNAAGSNGFDRVTIDSSGNVGIGTTEPNAKLQINGAISRQGTTLYGDAASVATQVNLGVNSITGTNGQNYAYATVAGGSVNSASGEYATVSGGNGNRADGRRSTVGGGMGNAAKVECATIGGGDTNIASGDYSTIPGGLYNNASGYASFAAGRYTKALHAASFVWSAQDWRIDGVQQYYKSNWDESFNINAPGGVWFAGNRKWQDVAEEMDFLEKDNLKEAELVSLAGNDLLGRTKTAYDSNLIGVISSSRTTTLHLGSTTPPEQGIKRFPVALVGRCFVKVNNESGPINVGDPITSSSIQGIGMKAVNAGKIVGYAMEKIDFKDADSAEVLVFINVGYYIPQRKYQDLFDIVAEQQKEIKLLKEKLKGN